MTWWQWAAALWPPASILTTTIYCRIIHNLKHRSAR